LVACAAIPLRDGDAHVIGVLFVGDRVERPWDPSDRRSLEAVAMAVMTQIELRGDVDRQQRVLDALGSAPAAVAMTRGRDHVAAYLNEAFRQLFGDLPLGVPWKVAMPGVPDAVGGLMDRVYETGVLFRSKTSPVFLQWPGEHVARTRYFDVSFSPIGRQSTATPSAGHEHRGLMVVAVEVTEEIQARKKLEQHARLQELLAGAAAILNSELDPAAELQQLAHVVVPGLADFASVHVLDTPARPGEMPPLPVFTTRVAVASIPELESELPGLNPHLQWDGDGDPITDAIVNGKLLRQPFLTPTPPHWSEQTGSDSAIRAGLNIIVLAPVIADGMVIAVVSFGMCGERAAWSLSEYAALEEVARLAGVALGHGMTYQRTRDTSLTLQRSLLSDPPELAGIELHVRYRPAGREEVGGDWYDAFPLGGNRGTALVVGDTVGHDIDAAAAMGHLRASLRTIALDRQSTPANVLGRLGGVNAHLHIVELATLLYCELHQTEDGTWNFHWSNAGHPPPILHGVEGARLMSEAAGPALVLLTGGWHTEASVELAPGSTVLLYTDGLVERRGIDIRESLEQLRATTDELAHLPLDEFCDALLEDAPTTDDIALLALRVRFPEDPT
jgi:serine phosphatase RsbU (regulator of sigma subunit)